MLASSMAYIPKQAANHSATSTIHEINDNWLTKLGKSIVIFKWGEKFTCTFALNYFWIYGNFNDWERKIVVLVFLEKACLADFPNDKYGVWLVSFVILIGLKW